MNISEPDHPPFNHSDIPPTLSSPRAVAFWLAVLLTGVGAGVAAGVLTWLLQSVEHLFWRGPNILDAAAQSAYPRHVWVLLGAAAVLAATTHGPISSVVLIMELTARDRSFMLPLLLVVVTATIVARTLDPRSIYDSRFSDQEVRQLERDRRPAST